jgi:hypothetical protein
MYVISMNWGGRKFPGKSLNMLDMILMEGRKEKKIQLVTSQVQLCDFMKDFIEKT